MGLFELASLLYLIHEVSAVYVLHDEIQTVLRRETEGRVTREGSGRKTDTVMIFHYISYSSSECSKKVT